MIALDPPWPVDNRGSRLPPEIERHIAHIRTAAKHCRAGILRKSENGRANRRKDKFESNLSPPPADLVTPAQAAARPKRTRKPTLASVAKQASKAEVARYEVKPDGSIVVVTGKGESTEAGNPWLDDLKVTKQ